MGGVAVSEPKNIGLRGVVVADTKISYIDAERGTLAYRGYGIEDLAEHSTFEETAYLILHGDLPSAEELERFDAELKARRGLPIPVVEALRLRKNDARPMDVLQSVVPQLAEFDGNAHVETKEANYEKALNLIAKMGTVIAHWDRIRKRLEIVHPMKDLSHAANFLYMLTGEEPDEETAGNLDLCLILHADHTFNASTFAAREVASTRANMYACASAALGALSGELHGGANEKVMEMLLEIKSAEAVEEFVKKKFNAGERIMGMGHAVYKTTDPRAMILAEKVRMLSERKKAPWYELAEKVAEITRREFMARKGRDIHPNVDFYSAPLYYTMGIAPDLYTPVFAVSRIAGWCAHIIEEKFAEAQPKPMLYRPEASYVGRYCGPESCEYVPLTKR